MNKSSSVATWKKMPKKFFRTGDIASFVCQWKNSYHKSSHSSGSSRQARVSGISGIQVEMLPYINANSCTMTGGDGKCLGTITNRYSWW